MDENRTAPICMAALRTSEKVVQLLLDRGADVNEKRSGSTPLMFSAQEGFTENCKVLLAAGADMTLKDWKGRTALERAIKWGQWPTASFLRDELAKRNLPIK